MTTRTVLLVVSLLLVLTSTHTAATPPNVDFLRLGLCTNDEVIKCGSGTWVRDTVDPLNLHFDIASPVASSINPIAKILRTVAGQTFCAVARGGTATDLVLTLRECTGAGAITCGSVLSANIEIDAVDTEVCGTIADTVWTAGGYLEMDVVSSTSSPTVVFGHASGE